MSFYKQSSEHDPTSPSSLYFNSYNPAKEQSFEEDLVALIGHGHGHGAHAHSGSAGSHHDLGLAHPQQQHQNQHQHQHQQQGAHSNHAGGTNSEQNPSNTMYSRPPHDIFGVGVGSVHPASFPSQSHHAPPFHNADPFSHFSQHLSNGGGGGGGGNPGGGGGSGATASSEFRALPSPADSYSALAHRNSLTSRSRSRSKPARSTRGTAASNAPSQIATGIKRDLSSPSPISSGPGAQSRTATLPIPISPLNMSIHSVSPPPQPGPASSLHGLAQSLPHSHWSAYLSNTHAAGTPSTPSYLPTPDSYSSFAPSGPFGSVTASSFATTNGMAQSLGAVSTMSTSPPPPTASTASGKDAGQDDPAAKQAQLASEKRRRRRESHNAVERRRRDNINEKISELATLIPEIMLDPTAGSTPSVGQALFAVTNGNGGSPGAGDEDGEDGGKDAGPMKANKGMILKKSVEYIRYLQQLVTAQANRNSELESQLTQYRNGQTPAPGSGPSQSAEEMQMLLASPGVMATMYEEPPESARASTESDEDMRPGTGAEEERGRGRAVQRLGVAGGVAVKTEDVAMES